ncbi:MAG: RidA family protein [Sphaerochaetaceae bacterium]
MKKEEIATKAAPAAIGPYSQAIHYNALIYTSGQLPTIDDAGTVIEGGIEAQAHQVLKNLKAVLEAGGSSLQNVFKTTIFLKNMDDFATVNQIYASYFPSPAPLPARSTVQVAKLPKDALVEIEAVAYRG